MSAAAETLPAMPLPTTPASVPLKPPVVSAPLQPSSTLPTTLQSPTAPALLPPTTSFALLPSTTAPELSEVPMSPDLMQAPIASESLLPQTAPEQLPLQNAPELPQPPIPTEVLQPPTEAEALSSSAPDQPPPLNMQEVLTQPPTALMLHPSPSTSKPGPSQSPAEQAPTTTKLLRAPAATTSPKPSSSSPKSSSAKHTVHWFRKGLRLHDNPSLREGLKGASTFRCIFIIDPWFASSSNVGINKWRFLLQCLQDLDKSLKKLNSRLFVIRGQPAEALPKLFREWRTTAFSFEEDPEPFGRVRDRNITSKCREIGIDVISRVSHTLFELDNIIELNGGKAPLTYHKFQALIAGMPSPAPPEPTVTLEWLQKHGISSPVADDHDDRFSVPTLEELGFDVEGLKDAVWIGGESEALARLNRHLERKAWVASFGRPKMTTQSLLASRTGLSPYLRFGCLSTRLFYYQLTELYERIKGVRPPLSLHGQLLWREFFYCAATRNPHFDRMEGNPICVQIPWEENQDALAKWANGQTGYPWIDAIMMQLRQEGWIHHLARHAVACFLTRGDLWISWEEGMKVFDELLLDADWSVNAGMWMWLSCSSFFQQFFHCYSPVRFGRKIDPNGDYIRKYVPVLRNMPTRFVHEPWEAPEAVQQSARCVIGQDYPLPMVDHEKASLINIERIKQVYAQLAKFKPQGALNPLPVQRPNETQSSPSPTSIITSINQSNYLCSPLLSPTSSTVQKIPYKDDDLFQRPTNVHRRSQFKQVVIVQRTQKSVSTMNTQRRSSRRDNLESQEKQESYDFKNLAINNVQRSNNRDMYHRPKVNRTEIYTQAINDDNCCIIEPKHYLYHRESGVRVVKVRSQSGARPNFNNDTTHDTMRHNRHISDIPDEGAGVHPMPVNSESYTGEPQNNDPSTSCRYPTSNDNHE